MLAVVEFTNVRLFASLGCCCGLLVVVAAAVVLVVYLMRRNKAGGDATSSPQAPAAKAAAPKAVTRPAAAAPSSAAPGVVDRLLSDIETCRNCGRAIGTMETPQIWKDAVVCAECHERLTKRS